MPLTILVAEADDDIRNAIGWLLSSQLFRVLTVQDVPSALWAIGAESIDLAIVDLDLPGADGREISGAMGGTASVILLSQADDHVPDERVVLRKPISITRLSNVVRVVLSEREAAEQARTGAVAVPVFPIVAHGDAVVVRS
jgi:DNA-binding response OmpR family regulator